MKVVITGGAGFIGLHLARRLVAMGAHVDLVESFQRGVRDRDLQDVASSPNVRVIEADLTHDGALDKLDADYDAIWHLAAIVGVKNVLGQPYQVLARNVRMLDVALEWAKKTSPWRFVFTSTSEVVLGTLEAGRLELPTPESGELVLPSLAHPRTSYMLSKIYGEAMCHASGLPFTAFRPHNIYGPRMGMSHVIPELCQRAREAAPGADLEVFSIDHRRTFCYIDDAVEMMIRAATAEGGEGQVYNVGRESPEVTIGDLAAAVLRAVGRADLRVVPGPVTSGSPSRRCPDTSQIRALTGHEPTVDLDDGIARTYAWYRERVFEGGGPTAR